MTDEEINEQELDRFEARFFGALPEAEAGTFDAELAGDAELKERYDLFVFSVRGIRSSSSVHAARTEALRGQFKAIDRELDGRPALVRQLFQPWMGWAAMVLVLLGGAGLWWVNRGDPPQELAEQYAFSEPGLPVLMSTSPRAMDAIMNAYKQDDLSTASRLLAAAVTDDPGNDTLLYFTGVVAKRMDGCGSAAAWFEQVLDPSVFAAKAQYNVALCVLESDDMERAIPLLNRVAVSTDAQVSGKARDLLIRLKNR